MNTSWKRAIMNIGILLIMFGMLPVLAASCITLLGMVSHNLRTNDLQNIIFTQTLAILTLGTGLAIFRHAQESLKGKPSNFMRLLPLGVLIGIFIVLLLVGFVFNSSSTLAGLFFPPIFLLLAMLPPLWTVSWFTPRDKASEGRLTWRRGLVAFCGGATFSVLLALILETLIPLVILALTYSVTYGVLDNMGRLLFSGNTNIGRALTDPSFVYLFIQLAVIAPLVEELVKPLVTLPLLRNLNRQETFWVGALAGAGLSF